MPPIKDPITEPTIMPVLDGGILVFALGCTVIVDDGGTDGEGAIKGSKDDVQT